MCILFAHRDQKCYQNNAACLYVFPLYCIVVNGARARISPPSQIGQVDWSHPHVLIFFFFFNYYYYCSTFQRSVHDWSALFVCTLKAEEGHLSVLKILCSWHL